MNGAAQLLDCVHSFVGLALGDAPLKGADRWAFGLDLLAILGLFIGFYRCTRSPWRP